LPLRRLHCLFYRNHECALIRSAVTLDYDAT
jgi:hypothetical protein